MGGVEWIDVEIVYALPERQYLFRRRVPAGTRVGELLRQSEILRKLPGIDLQLDRVGIFGRRVPPDTRLRAGDRVEIYRPLTADPKAVRRAHAAAGGNAPSRAIGR